MTNTDPKSTVQKEGSEQTQQLQKEKKGIFQRIKCNVCIAASFISGDMREFGEWLKGEKDTSILH